MSPIDLFLGTSAIIMCVITLFLVFHCDYEDGLVGRISLVSIFFSELVLSIDVFSDISSVDMTRVLLIAQFGVTLFFIRHVYRFSMWRWFKKYAWRPSTKK